MEEHITFPVGEGDNAITLEGLLSTSDPAPALGAVLCHPHPLYGGEMHNNVVSALAHAFQKENIATLRFNFRGVGRSEGSHDEGEAEREDVKAAVTALLDRQPVSTVVVAGYSFGSMVGLQAGAQDDRVHRLIGVAFPARISRPGLSGERDQTAPARQRRPGQLLPHPRPDRTGYKNIRPKAVGGRKRRGPFLYGQRGRGRPGRGGFSSW